LPFDSFVFPRNAIGHMKVLADSGLRTFRGSDTGWTRVARGGSRRLRQALNLADKMLPIPPHPVTAQRRGGLIDVPGSMLLLGRNGPRRFVLPAVTRAKLHMGLARARRAGEIFHFWFHPSNFYYRRDEQLATLQWFLEHASEARRQGRIEIRTMGAHAGEAGPDRQAGVRAVG
jgi:hypothetical protein